MTFTNSTLGHSYGDHLSSALGSHLATVDWQNGVVVPALLAVLGIWSIRLIVGAIID